MNRAWAHATIANRHPNRRAHTEVVAHCFRQALILVLANRPPETT